MQIMELLSKFKKKDPETGDQFIYTEEQLMARLKFFIGICLALTLTGIVFVVLYSIIFVTQPLNAISPIDQKFFELIIPIATFLTGTLSGIMLAGNDKDARMEALKAANKGGGGPDNSPKFPNPPVLGGGGFSASGNIGGANFSFNKPAAPSAGAFTPSAPSASFAAPAAPAAPMMSSTGKPMPVLENDEEL
jgi:hypothetical protein